MRWFPKPTSGLRDMENENYEDTNTKFYFYHDFKSGIDFETIYPIVREKYDRRIKRFYEAINNSKSVLFVWWSRDKIIPRKNIIDAAVKLSLKFNKNINILIFEHTGGGTGLTYDFVSDCITIVRGHLTVPENTTLGNFHLCECVFSQIKRSGTRKIRLIKKIARIIPIKRLRQKISQYLITRCQKY